MLAASFSFIDSTSDRSIERIAPEYAYSGMFEKKFDGVPMFVWPPSARYSTPFCSSSASPFGAWFSSERGSPRTSMTWSQPELVCVSLEMTPEFVSRLLAGVASLFVAIRQSLDDTYRTG